MLEDVDGLVTIAQGACAMYEAPVLDAYFIQTLSDHGKSGASSARRSLRFVSTEKA